MKNNRHYEKMDTSKKAYVLAYADGSDYYIPGALHVERNDSLMLVANDQLASIVAAHDGIPLIFGIPGVPDGVYVDTMQNRQIIMKQLTNNMGL